MKKRKKVFNINTEEKKSSTPLLSLVGIGRMKHSVKIVYVTNRLTLYGVGIKDADVLLFYEESRRKNMVSFNQFVKNMNNERIPEWKVVLYDKANPTGRAGRADTIKVRARNEQEARYAVENHLYGGLYGVKSIRRT